MASSFLTVEPSSGTGNGELSVSAQANRARTVRRSSVTVTTDGGASAELIVTQGKKAFVKIHGVSESATSDADPLDTIPAEGGTVYVYGKSNCDGLKSWILIKNSTLLQDANSVAVQLPLENSSGRVPDQIKKAEQVDIKPSGGSSISGIELKTEFSNDYGADGEYEFFIPYTIGSNSEISLGNSRTIVFAVSDLHKEAIDSYEIKQNKT